MLRAAQHDEVNFQRYGRLDDLAHRVAMANVNPNAQALEPAHRRGLFRYVHPQLVAKLTNAGLGSVPARHVEKMDGGARNALCQPRRLLERIAASFGEIR